jgi:hypothetical protein
MWPSTRPRTCWYGFERDGVPVAFTSISGYSAHPVAAGPTVRLPSPLFGVSVTCPPSSAAFHSVLSLGSASASPPAAMYLPSFV